MFRTIIYSAFAIGASLNLIYLAVRGFGTAYNQYHIASLVASYLTVIIMGLHLRAFESDWEGLWPGGIPPEFKRYVRIGMRVLGVPVLLGFSALSFFGAYHPGSKTVVLGGRIIYFTCFMWVSTPIFCYYASMVIGFFLPRR